MDIWWTSTGPDSKQKDRNLGKQLLEAEIERLMQAAIYMCPTEVRDILDAEYFIRLEDYQRIRSAVVDDSSNETTELSMHQKSERRLN
ncbi:hypothetical protein NPIL_246171 [Nephila pilipes]|uniref:Uncharacterized protein n=1 Tax=Nephila pilipes TaxID=299642 RepID=A0A8X6NYF7_NEPPI|nr:hypothetical protein NPIL_246171 [Nephila pilipes]